jgi:hypothetical protein
MDWDLAQPEHPCANTVRERFGTWASALEAAGLEVPPHRPRNKNHWSREALIKALHDWTEANGRAPGWCEWKLAAPGHPCSCTVRSRFGSWGGRGWRRRALARATLRVARDGSAAQCLLDPQLGVGSTSSPKLWTHL